MLQQGELVALRVDRRTSDRVVTGSTPAWALLHNKLRHVVDNLTPLSLSSISWYRVKPET